MEGRLPGLDGHYKYRIKAVSKCAKAVGDSGYEYFAMLDGGKCLAVTNIDAIYNDNSRKRTCRCNGKGSSTAIQVYEIRYSKTRIPPPPEESPDPSSPSPDPVVTPPIRWPSLGPPTQSTTTTTARITATTRPTIINGDNEEMYLLNDLGCWNYAWNDSIPSLEGTSPILDGNYSQRVDAVKKCAKLAVRFRFGIFAIQDGGRCASSTDARERFARLGMSRYCREDGRGGAWVNQVYEVNVFWDVKISGLGCHATGPSGPMASLEGSNQLLDGEYYRRRDAIRKCARLSAMRGYNVFGLQDGGKCMSDAQARTNFAKYGKSSGCADNGRGGQNANEVYEILSARNLKLRNLGCWNEESIRSVPGMEQTDGDLMGSYKLRKDAIGKCARVAARNGFQVFVLRDGGWCGGSRTA